MSLPAGYRIRARHARDDAALLGIENRAAALFRDHGYPDIADDPLADIAGLRRLFPGNDVWVAVGPGDAPVGYAVAGSLDGFLHLRELSVDPAHGRRGVGSSLVASVVAAAQDAGRAGVSLTTFRFVPFNRPFYERLGFRELALADASPAMRAAFHREVPQGIDAQDRLLMANRFPAGNSS